MNAILKEEAATAAVDLPVVAPVQEAHPKQKKWTLGYLGYGTGKVAPFDQVFKKSKFVSPEILKEGVEIDALVIWGGEDISPSLYGHRVSSYTGADESLSKRDRIEANACSYCIEHGIPLIGICRGAQLLCAVAGGTLVQHVNGHAGYPHPIEMADGRKVVSSSVHHQMMNPFNCTHELIAWASPRRATKFIIEDDVDLAEHWDNPEPEIVWFPKIKGLAIQGHPEFHGNPERDPFVQLCMELTRKYICKES